MLEYVDKNIKTIEIMLKKKILQEYVQQSRK